MSAVTPLDRAPLSDAQRQVSALLRRWPRPPALTPGDRPAAASTGSRSTLGSLLWMSDASPVLTSDPLVKGVITAGSAVVVYGDSNTGKSFFAMDLGLHVAAGRPWRGHRTSAGLVVHVAAEGGRGFVNRLAAYRREAEWTRGIPFAVLPQPVNLLHPSPDTGQLVELIRSAEGQAGCEVAAVIVDTLARVTPGGDENSSQTMSDFIRSVDRLRAETGAAVIIVHHAGKDAAKGARGHSSLRAAVDTEILVEGATGVRTATITKQRDLASNGEVFPFELVPVDLGTDEEGDPVTSCVVAAVGAAPVTRRRPWGKNQNTLLAGLREWSRTHDAATHITSMDLSAVATAQGLADRRRRTEAIDGLAKAGYLVDAVGGFRLEL